MIKILVDHGCYVFLFSDNCSKKCFSFFGQLMDTIYIYNGEVARDRRSGCTEQLEKTQECECATRVCQRRNKSRESSWNLNQAKPSEIKSLSTPEIFALLVIHIHPLIMCKPSQSQNQSNLYLYNNIGLYYRVYIG